MNSILGIGTVAVTAGPGVPQHRIRSGFRFQGDKLVPACPIHLAPGGLHEREPGSNLRQVDPAARPRITPSMNRGVEGALGSALDRASLTAASGCCQIQVATRMWIFRSP